MGRDRARTQVVASLLVSVVMLGFKLSALKRLVEVTLRRTELKAALAFLQPKLEEESAAGWLDDTTHDAAQRHARIGEMASPSGRVYTAMENAAIERGAACATQLGVWVSMGVCVCMCVCICTRVCACV